VKNTLFIVLFFVFGLAVTGIVHAQRFVDHHDGTVTDTQYNLMWTKDANPLGKFKWDDAVDRCSSFSLAGKMSLQKVIVNQAAIPQRSSRREH